MKDCEEMLACVVLSKNTIQVMCRRRGCMAKFPHPNTLQASSDKKKSTWTFLFLLKYLKYFDVQILIIIYNIIQDINFSLYHFYI